MKVRKIVIVGGGSTGLTAALSARKIDERASITILTRETLPPYRRMALPYLIQGKISGFDDMVICSLASLLSHRIDLRNRIEVKEIDPQERIVKAIDLKTNEKSMLHYDSLILATGGYSFLPSIEGIELKNVFTLRTFEDAEKIIDASRGGGHAVIAGGGLIALKVSEALSKLGVKVTLICRSRILRRLLEPELSSRVQKWIEGSGIKCLMGSNIEKIEGSKKVESIKVNGGKIDASMVVFAMGIRPLVDLAKESGIRIGKNGIHVDEYMRTSLPEIFAAGDCVESFDKILEKYEYIPVGSIGAAEGKIAGINAAGGESRSDGFIRAQTEKVFNLQIISIGHTCDETKKEGLDCETLDLPLSTRKNIFIPPKFKLVFTKNAKVIGAQAVGTKIFPRYSSTLIETINEHQAVDEIRLPLLNFIGTTFLRSTY